MILLCVCVGKEKCIVPQCTEKGNSSIHSSTFGLGSRRILAKNNHNPGTHINPKQLYPIIIATLKCQLAMMTKIYLPHRLLELLAVKVLLPAVYVDMNHRHRHSENNNRHHLAYFVHHY